jgi:hypothetical protein
MELKEALEIKRKYKKEWNELEKFGDLRYPPTEGLEMLIQNAEEVIEITKAEITRIELAIKFGAVIHTGLAEKQLAQIKKLLNGK